MPRQVLSINYVLGFKPVYLNMEVIYSWQFLLALLIFKEGLGVVFSIFFDGIFCYKLSNAKFSFKTFTDDGPNNPNKGFREFIATNSFTFC